ncbi:hypothetical protein [Haloferax marisrubri]|uniref:Uncharacterized protein n=1 Tax=Haloferax marisrubri TaxID=1544719 RepID=A0A2P4NVS9_9EURY|nr:hypothetical protein [Haloferax marisrubri]POG57168.1 hypothetical protein AUR65_001790 [Haloferax marisrubri]
MVDSFIPGADDAKDAPETGESWLIPIDTEEQQMARVKVMDVLDDGVYVRFEEDATIRGAGVEVEMEEGDMDKFGLAAFADGKPLSQ